MRFYKRGDSPIWWVDFSIDGSRIRRSTGTEVREQAEEYAAKVASDYWRQKRLGDSPTVIWQEAVIHWVKRNQHLKDLETNKLRLKWISERLKNKSLVDINKDVIDALIDEKLDEGVKPATVNRTMAALSVVLNHAKSEGWIAALPPIRKLKEGSGRLTWLTQEQATRLISQLPEHLRGMTAFALATGLRESNVRLLEWSQVDMANRVAWIHPDQSKSGNAIQVPLNDIALGVLSWKIGEHARYVFTYQGRPITKIVNHAWKKATKRAGLEGIRFHDMRHTWASWHVQAGTPLPVLQKLGGWASYSMVLRYAHLGHDHASIYAGNLFESWDKNVTQKEKDLSDESFKSLNSLGWLMGLEPTATGITIQDSTN